MNIDILYEVLEETWTYELHLMFLADKKIRYVEELLFKKYLTNIFEKYNLHINYTDEVKIIPIMKSQCNHKNKNITKHLMNTMCHDVKMKYLKNNNVILSSKIYVFQHKSKLNKYLDYNYLISCLLVFKISNVELVVQKIQSNNFEITIPDVDMYTYIILFYNFLHDNKFIIKTKNIDLETLKLNMIQKYNFDLDLFDEYNKFIINFDSFFELHFKA